MSFGGLVGSFIGLGKKARLHENAVPADQINGRAPVETSKKASTNVEKERLEHEDEIRYHFGCILNAFWFFKAK